MAQTILLTGLLMLSVIYHFLYRRQIDDFVKQLKFHGEENSNIEISSELKSRSIVNMQNELNALLDRQKKQRIAYEQREEKIGEE